MTRISLEELQLIFDYPHLEPVAFESHEGEDHHGQEEVNHHDQGDDDHHNHDHKKRVLADESGFDFVALPEDAARSFLVEPVFERVSDKDSAVIGVTFAMVAWQTMLTGLLEDEAAGMVLQVENTCDGTDLYFEVHEDSIEQLRDVSETRFYEDSPYQHQSQRERIDTAASRNAEVLDHTFHDHRRQLQHSSDEEEEECGFYMVTHITEEFVGK